ncbi:unnamed protein product [Lepidochelys kempii]
MEGWPLDVCSYPLKTSSSQDCGLYSPPENTGGMGADTVFIKSGFSYWKNELSQSKDLIKRENCFIHLNAVGDWTQQGNEKLQVICCYFYISVTIRIQTLQRENRASVLQRICN